MSMLGWFKKWFGGEKPDYKAMVQSGAIMIDVRTAGEFNSGHAKGAINIPLDSIRVVEKKYKKSNVLIVCCRSGMRSGNAKAQLKNMGFEQVHNAGAWQNLVGVK